MDAGSIEENQMDKRILVTYATRAGSTIEVADEIGKTLAGRGFSPDVKPVKENPPVEGYQAVLVGSAIRFGMWLPEAVEFIKTNQEALSRLPVALFTVHILNLGDDEQSTINRKAYLAPVRPLIKPVDEMFFSGKVDLARLSLTERLLARAVKSPVGDFRDWTKIHAWADKLFAS
jgi:menaquinone-dependent protoporphyrinogen oxidase